MSSFTIVIINNTTTTTTTTANFSQNLIKQLCPEGIWGGGSVALHILNLSTR